METFLNIVLWTALLFISGSIIGAVWGIDITLCIKVLITSVVVFLLDHVIYLVLTQDEKKETK